jgi:VWFA-related protein
VVDPLRASVLSASSVVDPLRASVLSVRSVVIFSVFSALSVVMLSPMLLAQQLPRYTERVDVSRVLVDARALDERGQPILGLGPEDFRVKIAGKPARVESVLWVAGGAVDREGMPVASTEIGGFVSPAPPGRLVVFLFQKDLEASRIVGFMRLLIETREFLESFQPADRVAVLSFDYHLKVWVDFTNDFTQVERILAHGILFEKPRVVEPSAGVSLVQRLDPAKGRKTYSMEKALLAIADALEPLPGAKSLVLVGHGWGRLSGNSLNFDREYGHAVEAFQAGRVSVFTLDTTNADYHTLDAGLISVAEHTGGFFERTHLFSRRALARLASALAGHYVLFVEKPFGEKSYHAIEVELTRRKGTVMAKSGFVG